MSTHRDRLAAAEHGAEPDGFRDRFWRTVEGSIDPFHDTDREVLPEDAWRFILYFANQAKGPFILLLITGGLVGGVDAAMYWAVGWLIDLLGSSTPASLFADHWPELAALLFLILVVRAVVLIASATKGGLDESVTAQIPNTKPQAERRRVGAAYARSPKPGARSR